MERLFTKPWLRAFAGLTINISAAWFAVAFIGPNVSLPSNLWEIFVLTWNIFFGIVFLLLTVSIERRLEQ